MRTDDPHEAHQGDLEACTTTLHVGGLLYAGEKAIVERTRIRGIPGKDPGEKGSGIHVWNTKGFRLEGNTLVDVRDGFYIQSSSQGVVRGNTARDLRYGLHYMFSDDNLFEDNTFENGAAGTKFSCTPGVAFAGSAPPVVTCIS